MKPTTEFRILRHEEAPIQIQTLPQHYALATAVPLQIQQSLQPNIHFNYNVLSNSEPIILQSVTSPTLPYNVPSTLTVLNPNNNSSSAIIHLPNIFSSETVTIEKQSSSLDIKTNQNMTEKSKQNLFKNEKIIKNERKCIPTDWKLEKERLEKLCCENSYIRNLCKNKKTEQAIAVITQPRKIGPKCSSDYCKYSSKRQCNEFTETMRNDIFNFFWNELNWNQRKVFVSDLVKLNPVKQRASETSRRNYSLNYFLRMNDKAWSVCKKMFINTVGIGECTLRFWLDQLQTEKDPDKTKIENEVKFVKVSNEDSFVNSKEMRQHVTTNTIDLTTPENTFQSKQQESPEYWIRDKVKKARERGEAYFGYCVKKYDTKTGRKSYGRTLREQRSLGPPCSSAFCERSTKRQCFRFTETIRQEIFDTFWKKLGWDERKTFISEAVDVMKPKRRTCIDVESSRRGVTCSYYLCINDQRYNICRQLFLSTLGIKEATVQYWLMQNSMEKQEPLEIPNQIISENEIKMRAKLKCETLVSPLKAPYKSKRIRLVEDKQLTTQNSQNPKKNIKIVPNKVIDRVEINKMCQTNENFKKSKHAGTKKTNTDLIDPFEDINLRNEGNAFSFTKWEDIDLRKEQAIGLNT